MLKRIRLSDVELGMFIHKLEGSWFKHPFWKSRFLLEDAAMLADLQDSGIDGVVIDISKGLDVRPWSVSRAGIMPVIRWSWAIRSTSSACCLRASSPARYR